MLHDENLSKLKRAPIETYIVTLWLVFAMFEELRKGNSGGGAVSRTRLFMENRGTENLCLVCLV